MREPRRAGRLVGDPGRACGRWGVHSGVYNSRLAGISAFPPERRAALFWLAHGHGGIGRSALLFPSRHLGDSRLERGLPALSGCARHHPAGAGHATCAGQERGSPPLGMVR